MTNAIYDNVTIKRFKGLQRVEPVVIDHSSLKLFKQCPLSYLYRTVLGYEPKDSEIVLVWGSTFHKFRESLEKAYNTYHKDNTKHLDCLKIAMQVAVDYWRKESKYVPVASTYEFMTENRLVVSLKASYDHWVTEKKQGKIEVLHIEQPFSIVLPDGSETCGRIDQIVRWSGRIWIRDFKTTKTNKSYYEKSLNPNDQLTRYIYAASKLTNAPVQGAMIEALYNTKTQGPEVFTIYTNRTIEQMERWEAEQRYWAERLKYSRENDEYPMNESYSCQWCKFQKVCTTASDAGKANTLKTSYRFNPWDPFNFEEEG